MRFLRHKVKSAAFRLKSPYWMTLSTVGVLVVLLFIMVSIPISSVWAAEFPGLEWEKTYGGPYSDYGSSVEQTPDGGYIVSGVKDSYSHFIIKLDANGNKEWEKTYSGANTGYRSIAKPTSDEGYILCRTSSSSADIEVTKLDGAGNFQWSKVFSGSQLDYAYGMQETSDGGYIIAGWTNSIGAGNGDVYLIKINSLGVKQWERVFGGTGVDQGFQVKRTADGGYIVVGTTRSFGNGGTDAYVIKVDSLGNKQWEKTFGTTRDEFAYDICEAKDGGYVIVGQDSSRNVWLFKIDQDGTPLWEKSYGLYNGATGYSIEKSNDGGYIVVGEIYSTSTGYDIYILKTDAHGEKEWEKTLGGNANDTGSVVRQTQDGGYIIVGTTRSWGAGQADVYLAKIAPEVAAVTVTGIAVTPEAVNLPKGKNIQLTVMANLSDGTTKDVTALSTYTSDQETVARVSPSGLITGVEQGSTVIRVGYEGKTVSVPVTVAPPAIEYLIVEPQSVVISIGSAQQVTVYAYLSDGSMINVTSSASYALGSSDVVTVSNGSIVGLAEGSTTMSVSYGGQVLEVPVTVNAAGSPGGGQEGMPGGSTPGGGQSGAGQAIPVVTKMRPAPSSPTVTSNPRRGAQTAPTVVSKSRVGEGSPQVVGAQRQSQDMHAIPVVYARSQSQ